MDLSGSVQVWQRVLAKPGEAVFAAEMEKPYARWGTAVIWLFAAGLVAVLVWLLIFLLLDPMEQSQPLMRDFLQQSGMSEAAVEETLAQMEGTAETSMFLMLCTMLIGIPGLALAWSGALWLMAKLLGGNGSLEKQTFLLASFIVPLVMVSVLLYLLPLLGFFLIIALGFYNLYLTFFAVKVAHGLTAGQTAGVVAVPLAAVLTITCCGLTLWLSLAMTALGTIS
jgi:hypothetical protein